MKRRFRNNPYPTSLMVFLVLLFTVLSDAHAQSPREELQQMVEQLQKTPDDNALREKIIRLGAGIKPSPAIPEEANRAFVKGNVFQKEAKDASGYALAITAYRDALRSAPWWGDVYFNLSIAQESAGKFDEAIVSIRNYLASVQAGSTEAREAQNKIYALEAKGEIASKQAVALAAAERERQRPSVEGKWTMSGMFDFQVVRNGERFTITGEKRFGKYGEWHATNVVADQQHIRFTVEQPDCPQCRTAYDLSLSPNGDELTGTAGSGEKMRAGMITRVP